MDRVSELDANASVDLPESETSPSLKAILEILKGTAVELPVVEDIDSVLDRIAAKVGGLEFVSRIRRGGMGAVYRMRDTRLKREVALKFVIAGINDRDRYGQTGSRTNALPDEASVLVAANTPGVITVYSCGEVEGIPFFTMEFFADGSLKDWLKHRSFSANAESAQASMAPAFGYGSADRSQQIDRIAFVRNLCGLAKTVHAIHGRHIWHLDLKPSNVMIAGDGTWRVGDFGLALADNALSDGGVGGTSAYAAPEQTQRMALGSSTDVFGLGGILYEGMTGRPPRDCGGKVRFAEATATLIRHPAELVGDLNDELVEICMRCLSPNQPDRYESADELANALDTWLKHQDLRGLALDVCRGTALLVWRSLHRLWTSVINPVKQLLLWSLYIMHAFWFFGAFTILIIGGLLLPFIFMIMFIELCTSVNLPESTIEFLFKFIFVSSFSVTSISVTLFTLSLAPWRNRDNQSCAWGSKFAADHGLLNTRDMEYKRFTEVASCNLECSQGRPLGTISESGENFRMTDVVEGRFEIRDQINSLILWLQPSSPLGRRFFAGVLEQEYISGVVDGFANYSTNSFFVVIVPRQPTESSGLGNDLSKGQVPVDVAAIQPPEKWSSIQDRGSTAFWTNNNVLDTGAFVSLNGEGYEGKLRIALDTYAASLIALRPTIPENFYGAALRP